MTNRRGALATVFLVVLIDLMGFGIVLPLLPFYATTFQASPLTIGLLYSVYSIMQLIFSPIWGSLSDRLGRRPIMLLSTFGASLSYLIFAFSHNLPLLFLSRALAGMMGGNIATAQAYITDVTPEEKRAQGMGMIGAAFGIGFVIGPSMAALLVHASLPGLVVRVFGAVFSPLAAWLAANRYTLPGLAATVMSAASFVLVLFALPESVTPGQSTVGRARFGVFSPSFWRSLSARAAAARAAGRRDHFGALMMTNFLLSYAQASMYSAFPLFCAEVLGMDAQHVGMQYVYTGLIVVVMQGGVIRVLARRFREADLFAVGSAVMAIGFVLIPFASSAGWMIVFLGLTSVGNGLNGPTLISLISKEADPSQVGMTMGLAQGMSGLGRVIGPALGGMLFAFAHPAPFWVTAAVVGLTVFVGVRVGLNTKRA